MIRSIAITGGIGSGKSSVGSSLRSLGYPVVDADALAREAFAEAPVLEGVVRLLGVEVLLPSGTLDRAGVREIIFRHPEKRVAIESIVHPVVRRLLVEKRALLEQVSAQAWLFYEVPLLYETGRQIDFDAVIVVVASEAERMQRVSLSRGISREEIGRIMSSQLPDERKAALADFVIDNSGTVEAIDEKTIAAVRFLRGRFCTSRY